jgi:hypothetical protein
LGDDRVGDHDRLRVRWRPDDRDEGEHLHASKRALMLSEWSAMPGVREANLFPGARLGVGAAVGDTWHALFDLGVGGSVGRSSCCSPRWAISIVVGVRLFTSDEYDWGAYVAPRVDVEHNPVCDST